jgi:hypothetical protein
MIFPGFAVYNYIPTAMQDQNKPATDKADNLDDATAQNQLKHEQTVPQPAYPNSANESGGAGSPYGGTKTADAEAPDGNQQTLAGAQESTPGKATLPEDLGDEYGTQSSYGEKGSDKKGDDHGDGDARGFVVR